jgi:hypothetical protein
MCKISYFCFFLFAEQECVWVGGSSWLVAVVVAKFVCRRSLLGGKLNKPAAILWYLPKKSES